MMNSHVPKIFMFLKPLAHMRQGREGSGRAAHRHVGLLGAEGDKPGDRRVRDLPAVLAGTGLVSREPPPCSSPILNSLGGSLVLSCLCKERSSSQCHLCPGHLLSVTVAPQLEAPLAVVGQLCAADPRPVCGTVLDKTGGRGGGGQTFLHWITPSGLGERLNLA